LRATVFRALERRGWHLTPNHFYEPVPDVGRLPDRLWRQESAMAGVDLREDEQLALLARAVELHGDELAAFSAEPTGDPRRYHLDNPQFGKVDAEILWHFVRTSKPRRVIEIGGGFSTTLTAEAILRNRADDPSYSCHLATIEPYPNETLRAGFDGLSELIVAPVQDVPLARFEELDAGDILFVDSSHVLKIGSDVQYEFLEVLPRLRPGVLVHVHDIFLPAEYPKHMVHEWYLFWNEQYLLQAFLCLNPHVEVRWGSCFMHLHHDVELEAAFGPYKQRPSGLPPSSFWFQRVS
jgi:predicted O-methyltransferase YrrM